DLTTMLKTWPTTACEPPPLASAGTTALTSMSRLLPERTRRPSSRSIRSRLRPGFDDRAGIMRSTFDSTSASVFFGTFTLTVRLPVGPRTLGRQARRGRAGADPRSGTVAGRAPAATSGRDEPYRA